MRNTFYISDTHFCHANILRFTGDDGEFIRPHFSSVEEMNEYIIQKWNEVVSPKDKVYHLGDVIMSTARYRFEEILPRLNGEKILIKGNHDNARPSMYLDYFKDIRSEVMKKHPNSRKIIFSHRPILLSENTLDLNVHGHTHQNVVQNNRYLNICVEHTGYAPISWNKIVEEFTKQIENEGGKLERKEI